MNNSLFSHKTDDWKTPTYFYKWLMCNDYVDPCPFHSKEDNLNKIYNNEKIYINPPYSQIDKWCSFIEKKKH